MNLQPTKHDKKADLRISAYVDNVMIALCENLGIPIPKYSGATVCLQSSHTPKSEKRLPISADQSLLDNFKWKRKCEVNLSCNLSENNVSAAEDNLEPEAKKLKTDFTAQHTEARTSSVDAKTNVKLERGNDTGTEAEKHLNNSDIKKETADNGCSGLSNFQSDIIPSETSSSSSLPLETKSEPI